MKVLVACEESQRVCVAFRERGHEAYSCDIVKPSGGHPEWHIKQDVLTILNPSTIFQNERPHIEFFTMDNKLHNIDRWDLIIAHPPCTYLTVTGNRWFNVDKYGESAMKRAIYRENAVDFFMNFVNAECNSVAIENPIGVMSSRYKKPTQIIHPYMFGDAERKATCLWLKGLPELTPTNVVEPVIIKYKNGKGTDSKLHMDTLGLPKDERARLRSQTFIGIAKAMAEQWG